MIKTALRILAAAAATGIALAPGAASAAPNAPAVLATSSSSLGGADPDTALTFSVNSGALSMSAPASAALGSGNPGTTIGPTPVGAVTVTDNRAALDASWTATAASTDFTTGGGTPAETIPATDVSYDPGSVTTTGTVTVTPSSITLSNTVQTVAAATGIVGDDTASWDPALSIAVPASALGGTYTATLTESVS